MFNFTGISGGLHEKPLTELKQTELMKKQQDICNLIAQFLMIKE